MATTEPELIGRAMVRDEDSSISIERIREDDGTTSVALWGTEDDAPDVALAYTFITEEEFLAAVRAAGYEISPKEVS